ncbi:MAG: alpha/beta hydrolase [Myxococcota bacterium]
MEIESISVPNVPAGAVNERGVITVPVNRRESSGQNLRLEFYRFRKLPSAAPATPPIFVLQGGPGYEGLDESIDHPEFYATAVERYARIADVVIIGQRGFGTSGATPCPGLAVKSLAEVDTLAEREERERTMAEGCRDAFREEDRDMSGFNIVEMAEDVWDVARALGYSQIQLKGNSFGSFWAMAVARRHPESIARLTLASLEGPDHTFDLASEVRQSLTHLASSAAESKRYRDRIPPEGLLDAYQAVIDRADQAPLAGTFRDDKTGEMLTVPIDGDALRYLTLGVRRPPKFRYLATDWPDDLLRIIEGDLSFAAQRLGRRWMNPNSDHAAETLVECSSGASRERRRAIAEDPHRRLFPRPPLLTNGVCEVWDDEVTPMETSSFRSSIPAVLVQGTWDISTPYANAKEVRAIFSDHHFITVDGGSHGAIHEAEEASEDLQKQLDHWYATGQRAQLPTEVLLPPMRWSGEQ